MFLIWGLWLFVILLVVKMEGLVCDDALVLVVVTMNGLGLWGWSEVVSIWNL